MDIKKNILGVDITRPNQKVFIMRGVSGSGKSTRANELVGDGIIHSTDVLIEATGDYEGFFKAMNDAEDWSPHSRMHKKNLRNATQSIKDGISPVIIDNTNLRPNESKGYVKAALEAGLDESNIQLVNIGTGGLKAEELANRNTHGVPLEVINKMVSRFNTFKDINLKDILESKDDILYCSVVLDGTSQERIMEKFGSHIPENWKVFNHHMTIRFGKGLPEELKGDLGKNVRLNVTHLGASDMALALKVDGYHSDNENPHVTLAVNVEAGGKPVMSNNITQWTKISFPFKITGCVTEHPR